MKEYRVNRVNQVRGFIGKHTNQAIDYFGPWIDKSFAIKFMRKEFDYCIRFMEEQGMSYKIEDYGEDHCKVTDKHNKCEYFEFYLVTF